MANPNFSYISHEAFTADVLALAAQLAADAAWRPDFVVGIGRGGLVPGVYLSHASGLPMLSIDHSSKVPEFASELVIKLADRTRAGERLLVVDDINDSGRMIEHFRNALRDADAIADRVRFAVLIDNIASCARVHYRARTIDRAVDKNWFVFPWEAVAPVVDIVEDAMEVPERLG